MGSALDILLDKRKQKRLETIRFEKSVEDYKCRIQSGNFKIELHWETDLGKMNFALLNTKTIARVLNNLPEDYEVKTLSLEKVIRGHTATPDKLFPKNDLWGVRDPVSTARLIEFVEKGNKIIPPIIQPFANGSVAIMDGHYRIALCRYIGLGQIPFIIRKRYLSNVFALL